MTRSNAIPTVLFIAIAISVGLNPPEAKDVVPNSGVQQSGNSSTERGIANFDTSTVVNSQTNIVPIALRGGLVGFSVSAIPPPISELADAHDFLPQSELGNENALGINAPMTGIYGDGANVLAQQ